MTLKETSSHLPKTPTLEVMTYERLLTEPKKLQAAILVLGTHGWEDLLVWLQAERQEHLERSVDSASAEDREGHRVIARWMKTFITQGTEDLRAMVETELADTAGDEQYMEFDSTEGQPESSNGSGSGPPAGIHKG